jgi:hypothetical protein
MTEQTIWEPGRNNLMPHMVGHAPVMRTAFFPDNLIFRASYVTDRKALQSMLPPGVSVSGEPVITFMYRHSRSLDWVLGGELNAVGACVAASFTGEKESASGTYWPFLWESDPMAVILGREIFGAPKLHATINNPHVIGGVWRQYVSEAGRPLLELEWRKSKPIEGDELQRLQRQGSQACVLGWKHIPTADLRSAVVSRATLVPSPSRITHAWRAEGEIKVHQVGRHTNFWTSAVMHALNSLPLLECLGAVLTEGSVEHRVAEGRDLA